MTDILALITDGLLPWPGVQVWRGRLPAGFKNTAPVVVVTLDGDAHADCGATRRASVSFRVYGGSATASDAGAVYSQLLNKISAANAGDVLRIGQLNGQELPPEPDTGWPAYNLRATARINERM